MGKSKNTAKSERKVTHKGCLVLKPQGSVRSKRDVQNFNSCPKSHKHAQGIIHDGIARCHTTVFDKGAHQSMIGRYGWEIIKRHDTWIYTQGVNMGGSSKAGRHL